MEKNLENVPTNGWQTMRKNTNEHLQVSSSGKRRKTTAERRMKQRRGQTRRRQPKFNSWNSFDPVWLSTSSLLLSSFYCCPFFLLFCCCLSFFFYLMKTLSVKIARLYFSHRLLSIGEHIFQVLFLTCLPHQQLLAFSSRSSMLTHIPCCQTFKKG